MTGQTAPPTQRIQRAVDVLKNHHSDSKLPELAIRLLQQTDKMAANEKWCETCWKKVKRRSSFCDTCGEKVQTYTEPPPTVPWQPQATWQDWQQGGSRFRTRRTPSPRPWTPRGRGQEKGEKGDKGRGKGGKNSKSAKGKETSTTRTLPTWEAPKLPSTQATAEIKQMPLPAASEERKLAQQLREAYQASGTAVPPAISDLLAKADGDATKKVTQALHAHTKALGTARKQVQQARQASASQTASWTQFLQQAVEAIDKGAQEHEANLSKLKIMEQEATERARVSRAAIRQLSDNAEEVDPDDSGEAELVPDGESMDLTTPEEAEVTAQVQKKLRMTLQELASRMPPEDNSTPKRRVKIEQQELPTLAAAPAGAAPSGPN